MALWTNEYLNGLVEEAEASIAGEIPCIIDRYSLEVFRGILAYELPDYVSNIKKVLYKGFRLDPSPHIGFDVYDEIAEDGAFAAHAFTDAYVIDSSGSGAVSNPAYGSRPFQYYYSTFGENVIRFDPGMPEDIPSYGNGLYGENIGNAVIIEFYRTPDVGLGFTIPEYVRRRTIKAYVCWKAFQKEGDGQNLVAAKYWQARYGLALGKAKNIIEGVNQAAIRTRESYTGTWVKRPARPVLPPNYGIPCGDYD